MNNAEITTSRPVIYRERCLNLRQGTLSCQVCIKNCPHQAIEMHGLDVSIDTAQCHNCGLCCMDCPTETFEQADFSPMSLLEQAQSHLPVTLFCHMVSRSADKPGIIRIPCLGLLDTRLLIALSSSGVTEITLEGLQQCPDCPTRVGQQRLLHTLVQTKPAIKRHFPDIYSDHAEVQLHVTTAQPQQPVATQITNRRTFLENVLRTSGQLAAFTALQALPLSIRELEKKQGETDDAVLSKQDYARKHLPQRQQLALFTLRSMWDHTKRGVDDLPWFTRILATGNCSACGSCALICPSGAITLDHQEPFRLVNFQTARCIDCNLCVALCPEKALAQTDAVDQSTVAENRVVTLFECEEASCLRCGKPFICSSELTGFCSACSHDRNIENDLFGNAEFLRITRPGRNL